MALPATDGIAVIDVVRGEDVALLQNPATWAVRVDDSGALITHGKTGLLRWPLSCDPARGRRADGPPRNLVPAMTQKLVGGASDRSCRVLAFPTFNDGARELILPEGRQIPLPHQEDVRHCAVSPDGSWVVTGSHKAVTGPGARISDAKTGRWVCDLPVTSFCSVRFSPDGKWLLTRGRAAVVGRRLERGAELGALRRVWRLFERRRFVGAGRRTGSGATRCYRHRQGGRAVDGAWTLRLDPLYFTRDGSRLVCFTEDGRLLCVFNLGLIRSKLAAMGLDWDAPPCPVPGDRLPEPVEVKFVVAK